MNMAQMQNDLRNLSDEQLQQVVTAPSHPLAPVVALGVLQERQRLRSEHQARQTQPAQATIADQVLAQAMTPEGQPVAPAMAAQEPIRMEYGGPVAPDFNRAQQDYFGVLGGLRGQNLPGMIPGADTLEGALALARQFMPDRFADYERMQAEYDAQSAERQRTRQYEALLQLGAGLLGSNRSNALSALGEAGIGAMPALLEANRFPEQERQERLERALQMAGVRTGQDATMLQSGLGMFGQGQEVLGRTADSVMGLGEDRANRETEQDWREYALQQQLADNAAQRAASMEMVRMQMSGSGGGGGGDAATGGMTPAQITSRAQALTRAIDQEARNQQALTEQLNTAVNGEERGRIEQNIEASRTRQQMFIRERQALIVNEEAAMRGERRPGMKYITGAGAFDGEGNAGGRPPPSQDQIRAAAPSTSVQNLGEQPPGGMAVRPYPGN